MPIQTTKTVSFAASHRTGVVLFLLTVWLGGARAATPASAPVAATQSSHPAAAHRLPLAEKADLQHALDTYKVVVLEPGNYATPKTTVSLKTGCQLYGDPAGTVLPQIVVAPGTTGAVLSTVIVPQGLTFPASPEVTRGNVFERLTAPITATGATLDDNLFLYVIGTINIDNSAGGYLRNSRFIRCRAHAVWPQLTLLGDPSRQSGGNVFLWFNFLTPHGDATNIANQKDLAFVGYDAETWNETAAGTNAALFKIGPMGTLRVFAANGGNHGSHPTPVFDVAADEFQISGDFMEHARPGTADFVLRPTNLRMLDMNSSGPRLSTDEAHDAFRARALEAGSPTLSVGSAPASATTLTPAQQATLSSMLASPDRAGKPWEAPRYPSLPDPAGPQWKSNRANQPDSTDQIQKLIDTQGVARLSAGIYYISRPLKLSHTQGIIGAGAATTAIVALRDNLDMIVANDLDPKTPTGRHIILADLTLQGGANGIHLEPIGAGTKKTMDGDFTAAVAPDGTRRMEGNRPLSVRAQYTDCYFNHVTFRDMSVAGIFMDQIYALDNIFVSNLNFVRCDAGWKQQVDPKYGTPGFTGDSPTMMYMDKVALYKCQFVENRIALDLRGVRSCNLNAWVNCRFENNREGAALLANYLTPLFANCDFVNNGGPAVVKSNAPVCYVSCRFKAGRAASAMFDGPVMAEGCSFARDGSAKATILGGKSARVFLNNCLSTDMPLGLPHATTGLLVNSVLPSADALNQQMLLIDAGKPHTILSKPTTGTRPIPQLLFGSDWSDDPLLSQY